MSVERLESNANVSSYKAMAISACSKEKAS